MDLRVFIEERNENSNSPIYLELKPSDIVTGSVILQTVDENGKRFPDGRLLSILPDGRIRFARHINSELGFALDDAGRLIIED